MTSPSEADIEAILLHRFPLKPIFDAFANVQQTRALPEPGKAATGYDKPFEALAEIEALREQLKAMPSDQVARLAAAARMKKQADAARHEAERQAKLKADQRVKEQARFYNQTEAKADFAYWCKADFWTLDEAVALLLGRDPRLVTPDALGAELKQPTGMFGLGNPPERAAFHRTYDGLRKLMERADALALPRLKPRAVLAWARRTGAVAVPAQLETTLSTFEAATASPKDNEGIAPLTKAHEVAARGTAKRWTTEELANLQRHKDKYGTKATAEKFGISPARVRALLPTKPAKPQAGHPFGGLIHRPR